ncbi:MAG: NAD(P)/FAD-dependent oxidoreductase [Calditrichaceae bacterium]
MQSEIVIIGGGLGGLAACAFLAQKGMKVVLVESQPHIGGYSIAFRKNDFIFDVALHAIPACAPGQPFYQILANLNIAERLNFIKLKNAFNVYLGEYNFIIPNSFQEFFAKLGSEFPGEQKGILRLRKYLEKYALLYFNVVEGHADNRQIVTEFIPKIPNFLKSSYQDTYSFLNRFVKNQRLKSLLYQAAVFFGEPMSQFPAVNFMIMFYLLFDSGMYTIEGGGQALSNALETKCLEKGAKIITGKQVQAIRTENNLAKSIILDDGDQIDCASVISNVNTAYLAQSLLSAKSIPGRYMQLLGQLKPSLSVLQLHLGLDCPIKDTGIKHYLNIIFPDENIDAAIRRQNHSAMIEGYSVLAPGINFPNNNSKNENILSIVGGVSPKAWIGLDALHYREQKEWCADQIINLVKQKFPGIDNHIQTVDLSTPHTFRRYTNNPYGAILGFKAEKGNHRKLLKISNFPVKNVFLASAWTHRLGGFMQSVKAGISAAEKSINYIKNTGNG